MILAACARTPPQLVLSGPTMGTTYSVKVINAPRALTSHRLRLTVEAELERVDLMMSGYRDDSEISRFNASHSTDWMSVSNEIALVIAAALEVSAFSNGAFDVTVAPLVRLWGFGPHNEPPIELPQAETITAVRDRLGYERLHVRAEPAALRKEIASLSVDLNGIAPGYAVDRVARRFDALGLTDYMIEIGGEIRARGSNADSARWRIAVERPMNTDAAPFAILHLRDVAVTTSGGYRHFYDRDGRRYSHTIDPRSARPVEHDLASVVVLHPTAMYADAWATAFSVLGAEEGFRLAEAHSVAAMFIRRAGEEFVSSMTPEFERYIADSGE